jgi:hypothetical protein
MDRKVEEKAEKNLGREGVDGDDVTLVFSKLISPSSFSVISNSCLLAEKLLVSVRASILPLLPLARTENAKNIWVGHL